jgi:hypothetical protein
MVARSVSAGKGVGVGGAQALFGLGKEPKPPSFLHIGREYDPPQIRSDMVIVNVREIVLFLSKVLTLTYGTRARR